MAAKKKSANKASKKAAPKKAAPKKPTAKKPPPKKPAPKKKPIAKRAAPQPATKKTGKKTGKKTTKKTAKKKPVAKQVAPKKPASQRLFERVDFKAVASHYAQRLSTHGHIVDLYRRGKAGPYAVAALGMTDPTGNFSAWEHDLGARILRRASPARILDFARTLASLPSGNDLPAAVRAADIDWLKISAASEMAAMLDPVRFWVTNIRTVWSHRVVEQNWNIATANEEIKLYRDYERDAAMEYTMWSGLHKEVGPSLLKLAAKSAPYVKKPGEHPYMWGDAISDWLYEHREELAA